MARINNMGDKEPALIDAQRQERAQALQGKRDAALLRAEEAEQEAAAAALERDTAA